MQRNWKSIVAVMLIAVMAVASFTACTPRDAEEGDSSSSRTSSSSSSSGSEPTNTQDWIPDLASLADEKWEENGDTVGWLMVPNTTIDDVVLWHPEDNDYYLRKNFEKRYDWNGVYYADKRSTFEDGDSKALGKNTTIYGHSMSDDKDGVKFGPMRYYLDEDFARDNPYIYFSTTKENLAWEVIGVYFIDYVIPYNRNDISTEEFAEVLEAVKARSIYNYNVDFDENDKYLTLSTCVYALPDKGALNYPNQYRLGIMAKLVGPDEEQKTKADFEINENVASA